MNEHAILVKLSAEPDSETTALLGRTGETNPFATLQYANAMRALGREVWLVGIRSAPGANAALACLSRGRLAAELEFPSVPPVAADPRFWDVVDALCRNRGITDVEVNSFGSEPLRLPELRGEVARRSRQEFVLDLTTDRLDAGVATNHKRNAKKAQKAGLTIRSAGANAGSIEDHVRLMKLSADRRTERGELVVVDTETAVYRALLKSGAAQLFQAFNGDEVLSSMLVLTSPRAGYYHSAGTSPEGMSIGASHFLVLSVAQTLKDEGRAAFNLGGAPEGSSLARFKAGFGAVARPLPSARCAVGSAWKRKLQTAARLVRQDRQSLRRVLLGQSNRWVVFRLDTDSAATVAATAPDTRFEALTEDQIRSLENPPDDPEFRARQIARLERIGPGCAYAVRVGDAVGHISWLLSPAAVAREHPAILELQDGEAEITACETPAAFRGKGLYPYAIACIANLARQQGIRRLYMKTREDNLASQRGILKAGLTAVGSVRVITPPLAPSRTIVRRAIA